MANHTITSRIGGIVSGTCGANGTAVVTVTAAQRLHKLDGGVDMYVKYAAGTGTNGTALSVIPTLINPTIHASDAYYLADDTGYTGRRYTFATAGNYRVNLPVHPREVLAVSAAFSGGTGGVAVIDFTDQGEN